MVDDEHQRFALNALKKLIKLVLICGVWGIVVGGLTFLFSDKVIMSQSIWVGIKVGVFVSAVASLYCILLNISVLAERLDKMEEKLQINGDDDE